jgi:hypothetical protein
VADAPASERLMASSPYYNSPHWRALRAACLHRDGYLCTVPGCGQHARVADHIETRPPVPHPTPLDVLSNTRSLCRSHDSQTKEQHRGVAGSRKQGGKFKVKGCTADGWPLDPNHAWNRK